MSVVVDIADDDRQRVRSRHRRTAAVPDDDRQLVLLALFAVECLQTRHHSRPVTVVTAA